MTDELELIKEEAQEKMDKAIKHLEYELSHLRAGRANPLLLDGIHVDYYGAHTPLSQVSSINTPDAKSILIQPWEKTMLGVIEKAILAANIGMTPKPPPPSYARRIDRTATLSGRNVWLRPGTTSIHLDQPCPSCSRTASPAVARFCR